MIMQPIVVNLLDLLASLDRDKVENLLHSFKCPLNDEIEDFLWEKSIEFSLQKLSITHLVFNERREIIAYFALSSKSVSISCDFLSNSLQRKIKKYGIYNPTTNNVQASAYLIAQFGKNAEISSADSISGDALTFFFKFDRFAFLNTL